MSRLMIVASAVGVSVVLAAACAPSHRARRDAVEAAPAAVTPVAVEPTHTATEARQLREALEAAKTKVHTEEQAKPPVKWAPDRLLAAELAAEKLFGALPSNGAGLGRRYQGTTQLVRFDVCMNPDGTVDPVHTTQIEGPADLGEVARRTILDWRYRRRNAPACGHVGFRLLPNGRIEEYLP